ncbi:MAG: transporter [Acidobacteriia bacterium]|nr:transporter [Terriglobia bacterium]
MGRYVAFLACVWIVTAQAWGQDPERALKPEIPELIAVGRVRTTFAVEFLHRARYSLSGLEGDLLRLGELDFRVGAGDYAEFQISGVCRDFLTITRRTQQVLPITFAGDATSDFGDLILGTKLKLATEQRSRPAVAFRFAVQLPNASNETGLGTDETDFFSSVLLSKHLGSVEILGNLGLAILGSPVQANSQADMLTYGFGITIPLHNRLELTGEVYGRQGPVRLGNESLSQVQAGARFRAAGLSWNVAGIAGLRHFNPSSGLIVGVTYEFQAFAKKRSPVTVRPGKPPGKR